MNYKINYKIIKNEIISRNLVLLYLEHIYLSFSVKKWKLEKNIFYHILAIISSVHIATYDWFRSAMPQMFLKAKTL